MKIIVIGLGSMGKRRISYFSRFGYEIHGYDTRKDRIREAALQYHIKPAYKLDLSKFDCVIICTPPDKHGIYKNMAEKYKKPYFCEAGFDYNKNSMEFNPDVQSIKHSLFKVGKPLILYYHVSSSLHSWHPYEKDFYGWNEETAAAKEMMYFDLSWIVSIFGQIKHIKKFYFKQAELSVTDFVHCIITFESGLVCIFSSDVISTEPKRHFRLVGSKGVLQQTVDTYDSMYEFEMEDFIRKHNLR